MSEQDDATLLDSGASPVRVSAAPRATAVDLGDRYELGPVLGRGGMGEVRLARDVRIDREVAVKLMRGGQADEALVRRFFREARVQGVLEHPALVPVHDLGIDATGNPYFVMKRLTGTTLADVLTSPDAAVQARWPRRTLLARLVDVSLAIELAHTRGVIHRDLKPANLMLGDFGEAYVLDWGLARATGDLEGGPVVTSVSGDGEAAGHTQAGSLLGTPGYMSPEQARGDVVGPATDVFALGCVLFEVLAGAPAMPRGTAGLAAAVTTPEHRPSTRTADVPPELDDLCARATAQDPLQRPTARALADGIQAFLDGDRDTERRIVLAAEHARRARAVLDEARPDARTVAMREAGRALALDPTNATAQDVLAALLVSSPEEVPPEALAAADAERSTNRRDVARWATHGYLGFVVTLLLMLLLPLESYWPVVVSTGLAIATWLVVRHIGSEPLPMRSNWYLLLIGLSSLMIVSGGLLFGPMMVMPLFVVGAIAGFLAQSSAYHPATVVVPFVLPLIVMVTLEITGVTPRTWGVRDGAVVMWVPILKLTTPSALVIFIVSIAAQIGNTIVITLIGRKRAERSLDLVHAHAWHLKHLLPDARPAGTPPAPTTSPP